MMASSGGGGASLGRFFFFLEAAVEEGDDEEVERELNQRPMDRNRDLALLLLLSAESGCDQAGLAAAGRPRLHDDDDWFLRWSCAAMAPNCRPNRAEKTTSCRI